MEPAIIITITDGSKLTTTSGVQDEVSYIPISIDYAVAGEKFVICVYCRILNTFSRFDYLMQLRVTYLTDFSVCSTDRQIFLNRNPFCEKLLSLPPVSSCMCIFEFM